MKKKIHEKDLFVINTTLFELTCLRRWSEINVDAGKYTELAKQAFNCFIAFIWSVEAMHLGYPINFTLYPKIAISRAFRKSVQCDIPEYNLEKIFKLGKISKASFDEMIHNELSGLLSKDFFGHLTSFNHDCLEIQIYKGATKLATLLELDEIKNGISSKEYQKKNKILQEDVESFSDLPGYEKMISEKYLEIFSDYSQLRNRIRWAKHPNIIKNNVLGHLFDVGVFAYLMSLDKNPEDEGLASRFFFMGIFHDFPERWTGDMPSPLKDKIKGLREATEEFENLVMEENVYSLLPYYQVEEIRKVMLEDKININLKRFLKKSDTFAAFIECWREIDSGSHHRYYIEVMDRSYQEKEKLPELFRLLMERLYGDLFFR